MPNLARGLENFCREVVSLFAAVRAAVWVHDREARELVLQASSASRSEPALRVSTAERGSPLVRGLRQLRPLVVAAQGRTPLLVVPLRGRRRALGVLVLEGVPSASSDNLALIEDAALVGEQLSSTLENVQLLQELVRSRRELESTVDSILDLVIVCDDQLHCVYVNRPFAHRVNRSAGELRGRPLTELVAAPTAQWIASVDPSRSATAAARFDDQVLGGTFSVTVTRYAGAGGEAPGRVIVARDLTVELQLEAERAILRDRLAQSQKLAALGQLVAGIAHEMNNPLQVVLGHLELISHSKAVEGPVARDLRLVYREADRAARIVRKLLLFAGSHRVSRRGLSLNAIVQRALALRGRACRAAGIEVTRRLEGNLPRVLGDGLLLQQAVLNLLMNAEQALESSETRRIEVRTGTEASRRKVVLTIRDHGPGIPPEVLPRMFEPFFTTKPVGQGTGLGLALTYGIIRDHGGEIVADNHPGGGARLTVRLPAERKMVK